MKTVLNKRERDALWKLSTEGGRTEFMIAGQLVGFGKVTLQRLVDLGLAEVGPSERHYGENGWRVTENGYRAMYGMSHAEVMALPEGYQVHELRVWSWPPTGEPRIVKPKSETA